jgi:hypothetical protein
VPNLHQAVARPRHNEVKTMRIYMFKSEAQSGLRAFAGDLAGSRLPTQFAPWHVTGVIGPDNAPPYSLPRNEIEKAIDGRGFQLWRKRSKAKSA